MEFKFVFIDVGENNSQGWWLKLSNPDELMAYHEATQSRWGDAFDAFWMEQAKGIPTENRLVEAIKVKADGKSTAIGLLQGLRMELAVGQLHSIQERGYIHVNKVGGYCSAFDEENETQWVRRKNLTWPDYTVHDIRVKQYAEGAKHWYAFVGDCEVRDIGAHSDGGDIIKWNTYQEAYDQAVKYVKEA